MSVTQNTRAKRFRAHHVLFQDLNDGELLELFVPDNRSGSIWCGAKNIVFLMFDRLKQRPGETADELQCQNQDSNAEEKWSGKSCGSVHLAFARA